MTGIDGASPDSDELELRVECLRLRRRIEWIGDEIVRQIVCLDDRPRTRQVRERITMLVGRAVPDDVVMAWAVVNAARHAYGQLSDVIHGCLAWSRIPATDMAMWRSAIDDLTKLAEELGVIDGTHATMAQTSQPEQ